MTAPITTAGFAFATDCTTADGDAINDMVDGAREVLLATFRRRVTGVDEWAKGLGYAVGCEEGLHLKDDWHVSYHSGTYLGRRCYYAVWSGVEYVFTPPPGPGGGL